jgi:LPXTG-motif cell wall-anchored protein
MKRVLLVLGVVAALLFMAAPANAGDGYPPSDNGTPPAQETVVTARPPSTPSGALPNTGDDSSMTLARVAVVTVAAGGLLVLAARKRRASLA